MGEKAPAPTRYGFLFGVTVGILFAVMITGIWSRQSFTLDSLDQWMFLGHLLLAFLFPVPFVIYLIYHVAVVVQTPALRSELGSHVQGTLVVVTVSTAVGTGIVLGVRGGQTSMEAWAWAHQVSSYASIVLLPVHVLWALYRRRVLGRSALLPLRDRVLVPTGIIGLVISSLAFLGLLSRPLPATLSVPADYSYVKNAAGTKDPFFPGLARTSDGQLIEVDNLAGSKLCAGCHQDIFDQWRSSTHSFAASNDHYLAQVKLRINDVPVKPHMGARFCANCHEPIALLAGEIDPKGRGIEIPQNREEGLSCLACHRIQGLHGREDDLIVGNANYMIAAHRPYLFQTDPDGMKRELGNLLVRSKPSLHRDAMMKPLLREPEFCSTCHKFAIDEAINGHGFFRLQNTYDEWKHSPYGDRASSGFRRCQDCHMPLVASDDPAAKPYQDGDRIVYKVRDHRFLGSNTMRPFLDGDQAMLEATREFLESGIVALQIQPPDQVRAGQDARFKVVAFNDGVGHRFPTGTTDVHDCWIELLVKDGGGREIFHTGELDAGGFLDPGAHRFHARAVDEEGRWLYRRDMWNLAGFESMNTIFAKNFSMASYLVKIPVDASGPLSVEARLNFRKSNQNFTNFVFGRGAFREESRYTGPHPVGIRLPVTTIARARVDSLAIEAQDAPSPPSP